MINIENCRYYWHPKLSERKTGHLCPEVQERNDVLHPDIILKQFPNVKWVEFERCHPELLKSVHDEEYIDLVKTAFEKNIRFLDSGDIRVTENIYDQAHLSASAGIMAVRDLFQNNVDRVFCAIRPPGHHANKMRAMGFCIFNNIALAARYAQNFNYAQKILTVDLDVHPGNGTQEIFYEDPTVFTVSFHQEDLFQESGRSELTGAKDGEGFNRNFPLKASIGIDEYLELIKREVKTIADKFQPDLLLISMGFDGHERDFAAQMNLTSQDYGSITRTLLDVVSSTKKCISFLEGGYNPQALQESVIEHCQELYR